MKRTINICDKCGKEGEFIEEVLVDLATKDVRDLCGKCYAEYMAILHDMEEEEAKRLREFWAT